ncbi:MAG TPA: protein kinase, partial [Polyangium sp.]|nr:protein kinase [Polyangium sp.]
MSDSEAFGFAETAADSGALGETPTSTDEPVSGVCIEPGSRIKHYEIIRKLGEGGMGAVYLGRDTRLGRRVAMKFLHDQSGRALDRFLVEARATALCQHENIVVIYDVDDIDGSPYMVLEYIEGQTLRSLLHERFEAKSRQEKPSVQWVVEIMISVARALSAAHAMRIVHRDLKPENILLTNSGLVKVVDFGIAKQVDAPIAVPKSEVPVERLADVKLTQDGVSPGTMMYMSPEQWLGDEIDARTDIWAAGLILFELLTGVHPLAPVTITALTQVVLFDFPMPSAKDKRPDAAALSAVIDRCLRKRKEERYASADELCAALEGLSTDRGVLAISDQECPFAGLSAFQEADAGKYFGRERDLAAVLTKLRHQQLVAIAGPSGAGKSSFVRAGIIPTLRSTEKQLETWTLRPGRKPLAALGDVLVSLQDSSTNAEFGDAQAIERSLVEEPGSLGLHLRNRCRQKGPKHQIVLFVDQFEELYTLSTDARVREAFVANLLGVADDASSPLRVILSIRADFLDRMAEDRSFLSEVMRGLYFSPPMGPQGLRDALEKPLAAVRYEFDEADLVDEILRGLEGVKSPLPILQFLATKLWETRDEKEHRLTTKAYHALGGVAGALSMHADAMLEAMSPIEQKITRAIFLRLVTPERTRALVLLDELCGLAEDRAAAEQVLQRLSEARLIAIESGDEREGKTVELVHESLIERWGKLRQWLDENKLDVQFVAELRGAAAQWEKNGKADGFLWREEAARRAESWLSARQSAGGMELAARELEYLNAVVRLAERTRRRLRAIFGAGFVVTVMVAVIVSLLAFNAKKQAARADEEATHARVEAKQARNATRLAAAREMQTKDPTKALALLREIEPGPVPRGWVELVLQTRYAGIAERVKYQSNSVWSAKLSPDGRRVAVALTNRTLEVWDVDGSGESVVLRGHEHSVDDLAWSHDGRRIASGSRDKTVRIWNADGTGTPVVLAGHEKRVVGVDWSPDDQHIVAVASNESVRIWKTDGSNEYVVVGPDPEIHGYSAAWSPDGKHIAIGMKNGDVHIWDAAGKDKERVLRGHQDMVTALDWSPDGEYLVSAARDKTARIWDALGAGESRVLQGHQDALTRVRWSPNGRQLATGSYDKTIRLWNIRGDEAAVVLRGHEGAVWGIDWAADGARLISASVDREVRVWNIASMVRRTILVGHSDTARRVFFRGDGKRLVTASSDKTARIWDLEEYKIVRVLRGHDDIVNFAAFSHDGERVVSASDDMTVRVWQSNETSEPLVFRGHKGSVRGALFTPSDRLIVTNSDDETIRIWDSQGQKPPIVLRGHERQVGALSISPDGQTVASGAMDRTIRLWSLASARELRAFRGHTEGVWGVSWSPDGRRIVSGGDDSTLRIWNADGTGEPLVLMGHRAFAGVHSTSSFEPNGRRIVSSSVDGTVRIWNANGTGEAIVLHAGDIAVHSA